MNRILSIIFLLSNLSAAICVSGQNNYVSFHLKNETFSKGRLMTIESDYFFDAEKGELVVHGNLPKNHVKISNRLGEVKIFFPDENSVTLKQDQFFSSENELIYYFITNNYFDLGLSGEGFRVSDTRMDEKFRVVTWQSPPGIKQVGKVELVFDDDKPVYAAYFDPKGKIIRKIYYYNYEVFGNFILPLKVTQISFQAENDSVIQRNTWSNVRTSSIPGSFYFNYKIPDDAKISR